MEWYSCVVNSSILSTVLPFICGNSTNLLPLNRRSTMLKAGFGSAGFDLRLRDCFLRVLVFISNLRLRLCYVLPVARWLLIWLRREREGLGLAPWGGSV